MEKPPAVEDGTMITEQVVLSVLHRLRQRETSRIINFSLRAYFESKRRF